MSEEADWIGKTLNKQMAFGIIQKNQFLGAKRQPSLNAHYHDLPVGVLQSKKCPQYSIIAHRVHWGNANHHGNLLAIVEAQRLFQLDLNGMLQGVGHC